MRRNCAEQGTRWTGQGRAHSHTAVSGGRVCLDARSTDNTRGLGSDRSGFQFHLQSLWSSAPSAVIWGQHETSLWVGWEGWTMGCTQELSGKGTRVTSGKKSRWIGGSGSTWSEELPGAHFPSWGVWGGAAA